MFTQMLKKWFSISMIALVALVHVLPLNLVLAQQQPQQGTLRVTTNITNGGFTVKYANTNVEVPGAMGNGVGPIDITMAPDLYDIEFRSVSGYTTPALIEDVNIIDGALLIRHGEYTITGQPQQGTLRVTTNLSNGGFDVLYANTTNVVSGASNTGVGPFDITLAPDLYDIRFTDVTGYNTPALIQDVNITNGVTEVRHGEYTVVNQPQQGTLRVTTNLSNGGFDVLYANTTNVVSGASNTGVGPFDITLAPDLYDIRFTDVTGYNTPALIQDVNITNGVTEVRHGEYTVVNQPQQGTLRVTTN
ncbi:hypothetical protein IPJ72_04765 [Candidatus Peregrinibacteria bacterium]|nr:MAG: hypothetical protein IPJ72_04765 [Candidatus Peregrinibacteria bacterium]